MKILDLKEVYYDNINFKRIGAYDQSVEPKFKIKDSTLINKTNSLIKVILSIVCDLEGCLNLTFDTIGVFKIESSDKKYLDDQLEEAFKTLIPFIRNELSLLTSQPGLKPVILPMFEYGEVVRKNNI